LEERVHSYVSDKKITVIPNGVDVKEFQKDIPETPEVFLGVKKEHRLISASRLVEKNGIDITIRALADLPDFHLFLVGDGILRSKSEELANELNIADRVHFIGEIPYESLSKYLKSAEIFIRPSRSEGLGTAFIEAMAAGNLVIGTAVGGIVDILKHEENSLIVPVGDHKKIIEAVVRLTTNRELARILRENAEKFVSGAYDWKVVAEQMNILFNEIES